MTLPSIERDYHGPLSNAHSFGAVSVSCDDIRATRICPMLDSRQNVHVELLEDPVSNLLCPDA